MAASLHSAPHMHRRASSPPGLRSLGFGGLIATVLLSAVPWASGAASDPFAAALPGADTQPPEGRAAEGADQVSQQHIDYMLQRIPMGRFGTVEEIASMVCWLCTEDASFTTGGVFDLSGGRATY